MSVAERDYFGPRSWKFCWTTFEWIHIPSGLSMYDLWHFTGPDYRNRFDPHR